MEFEIKMTSGILYSYLLRQNYLSFAGWVGNFLGVMMIVLYFYNNNIWALVGGLVIIFYPPCSLFMKSKKQMLLNPAFKKPLHYSINDEGLSVSQGEASVQVNWEQLFKVVATKKFILIYTSPVNSWILPLKDLGDKTQALKEMIIAKMPANKTKSVKN